MAVKKISYNSNIYIQTKDAKHFGLSESDITKLDSNNDSKITVSEVVARGVDNYQALATHFDAKTEGALFASLGKVDKTQPTKQVGQTNPIPPTNTFVQNTFAFTNAKPNRPEHRDFSNADLLDYPKKGQNIYMLG